MDFSESSYPGGNILVAKGRIDSATAAEFEKKVMTTLEQTDQAVIVDLAGVGYISSAGLRVVLMAAKRCNAARRGFALCGLNDNVREVFRMSGFDRILTITDDQQQAQDRLG